ncbi:MAG: ferritin [Desulfobacteraceae bacterium]|jgi:rubrerythrin|nr:MAG: ferritin [Desulfobacteraceae bacterium]
MEAQEVCYTREGAISKAIEMETKSFATYQKAYQQIKERRARELAKELALDELEHKYTLEKAVFEETVALHESGQKEGPVMKLSILLQEKPLGPNATDQDLLIHAIHEEKRAVDFYKGMATQCVGAPMEAMFRRLSQDEENHLAKLESLYESIYMKDM